MTEDEFTAFKAYIANHPTEGEVIPGTGGVSKIRWAVGAKGKRGGARFIYFYVTRAAIIYLLEVYTKSTKENLTNAERNEYKKLTAVIKRSHRRI
ncbi:MAG: type II toxin-antitoxin system RelE/ParE family toxin [Alphaproteobacteria bacterium]|nr:type II toxin-antitoxin system RelE/ParE family toxin [Alphaproteobacteria bacterium]MDP6588812.1 type II toxin-antitoxin system RelE/ParE family toxin [Alphaproteobacteria bacterium]